jgi:hypothetical protein
MKSFVPLKKSGTSDADGDSKAGKFEAMKAPKKIGKVTRSKKSATNFLVATYNMVEVSLPVRKLRRDRPLVRRRQQFHHFQHRKVHPRAPEVLQNKELFLLRPPAQHV